MTQTITLNEEARHAVQISQPLRHEINTVLLAFHSAIELYESGKEENRAVALELLKLGAEKLQALVRS